MVQWLVIALVALAAMLGAEQYGHHQGYADRALEDQKILDSARISIDQLHTDATAMILQRDASNERAAAAEALSRDNQEKAHVSDQARTEAENRAAAAAARAHRLQLTVSVPAAACGPSGGIGVSGGIGAAGGADRTATVELPAETGASVLTVGLDADQLADAYRQCYRAWYPSWREAVTAPAASSAPTP